MPRPFLLPALLLLVLLLPAVALGDDRARELNDQGVAKFEAGDAANALVLFREALQLAPQDATFRHNASRCLIALGDECFRQRDFRAAARDYHEASTLVPDDVAPVLREATALQQAGQDHDVVTVLNEALNRWPDQARGHDLLARSLYALNQTARAIEHWERCLRLEPGNEQAQLLLDKARQEHDVVGSGNVGLEFQHFSIKYEGQADAELGQRVGRALEDAYRDVGALLGRYPEGEIAVVIYPAKTFRSATGAHGWVAALFDGKIRVPAAGLAQAPDHEVRRVITHEFAHALLRSVGGPKVPVWLHEGFAQLAEGRNGSDARQFVDARTAPTLEQLSDAFTKQQSVDRARQLYAAALGLTAHLLAQGGPPLLADLLDRLGRNESLADSLRRVYGRDLGELHAGWLQTLR